MNPAPKIPPEICRIFLGWAATARARAKSLNPNSNLRPKLIEAAETVYALGQFGGDSSACKDESVVLQDPTDTYSRIVFLADFLGQLPATALPTAPVSELADGLAVNAWMRIQKSWNSLNAPND